MDSDEHSMPVEDIKDFVRGRIADGQRAMVFVPGRRFKRMLEDLESDHVHVMEADRQTVRGMGGDMMFLVDGHLFEPEFVRDVVLPVAANTIQIRTTSTCLDVD